MSAPLWHITAVASLAPVVPAATAPTLQLPAIPTSSQPAQGQEGRVHFDQTTNRLAYDDGSNWQSVQPYSSVLAGTTASFTTADETKLDGIEAGATADQSAAEILSALLTVDGSGSGLDADLLDGLSSAAFALVGHDHSGVYQPLDASLTAFAALVTAANKGLYFTAADTPDTFDLTAAGRTWLGLSSTANQQAALSVDDLVTLTGVADGSTHFGTFTGSTIADSSTTKDALQALETAVEGKQPLDATLTAMAGQATAADKIIYFDGVDDAAVADFTSAGRSMVGAASAAAQTALLSAFVAAGGGHAKGLVPTPGSTAHANQPYILKDSGSWAKPLGMELGSAPVDTSQDTVATHTTFQELTTTQRITFTLDVAGTVRVIATAETDTASNGNGAVLGIDPSTGTAIEVGRAINSDGNGFLKPCVAGGAKCEFALSAGTYTFKLMFRCTAAEAATFATRSFRVVLIA